MKVGDKIRGFKFETRNIFFNPDMEKHIGQIGEINYIGESFISVVFENSESWAYPKDEAEQYLVKEEPNWVLVRDGDSEDWEKRILLHDLGEKVISRYIVVTSKSTEDYLIGNGYRWIPYCQMKPIEEEKDNSELLKKIENLEKEIAEIKQQIK